jgi:hypothetical protein
MECDDMVIFECTASVLNVEAGHRLKVSTAVEFFHYLVGFGINR